MAATSIALVGACAGRPDAETEPAEEVDPGTGNERVSVLVDNRATFDVAIYVLRSPTSSGARVGTVNSGSSGEVRIRVSDLQPGNQLVLRVRAVGARYTWVSGPLLVSMGTGAKLDVRSTANGDLSQTTLYSRIAAVPVKTDTTR